MTDPAPRDEHRDERRRGARSGPAPGGMSSVHLRLAILPATAVAVLGVATVAFVLVGGRSELATRIVLVAAAALAALALIAAVTGAAGATRRLQLQVAELRRASSRAQDELALLTERAQRGEQPILSLPPGRDQAEPFEPPADSDGLAELAGDLERERHAARQAVVQVVAQAARQAVAQAAGRTAVAAPDQRVEVFVNVARRMQSLVHQEIALLDDLEAQVEDPALLKGLFTVDHLATRMRRQSESLAVLGGAVSRRHWSRPVTVHEVLRAAVAEVEQYSRVKVVPPVEGALSGSAVTDVIHLTAELIENATTFSAPHAQVMVRAQLAAAGLVVEVEDRGLGMRAADQQRLNALLADPSRVNPGELLRDGRIGLFVVAALARRHGIRVQLQTNIYGGVQAVIVLPRTLIEAAPQESDETMRSGAGGTTQPGSDDAEPVPPVAREAAAADALPARQRAAAPAGTSTGSAPPRRSPPARRTARPPRTPRTPAEPRTSSASRTPLASRTPSVSRTLPAPAAEPAEPEAPGGDSPELPRRVSQTHLAPELREARPRRRDGPAEDQLPGLMAAFQRGISKAAEEDRPAETDSPR
jgi:signal transduction histidine kinase